MNQKVVTPQCAHKIMGQNFFGAEEAIRHYGAKPTMRELGFLSEVPFTEKALEERKETHILVAPFLSVLDVRSRVARKLFYHQEGTWVDEEDFSGYLEGARWYLMRKSLLEDSTQKTWDDQKLILPQGGWAPTAQVATYAIIGYYLMTGQRLFPDVRFRCSDVEAWGCHSHIIMGDFDEEGIRFYFASNNYREEGLGIISVDYL